MKKISLIILLVLLLSACAFLDSGYYNYRGNYVPKRPNYKLKDKQGSVYSIDTSSIYKLVQTYNNSSDNVSLFNFYIKFYAKGRYIGFIALKDSLKKCDFDPNTAYHAYDRAYYTCNGQDIKIETFVRGDGTGFYHIENYVVNKSMDTLTQIPDIKIGIYSIYKRVPIPINFKKYKIDW